MKTTVKEDWPRLGAISQAISASLASSMKNTFKQRITEVNVKLTVYTPLDSPAVWPQQFVNSLQNCLKLLLLANLRLGHLSHIQLPARQLFCQQQGRQRRYNNVKHTGKHYLQQQCIVLYYTIQVSNVCALKRTPLNYESCFSGVGLKKCKDLRLHERPKLQKCFKPKKCITKCFFCLWVLFLAKQGHNDLENVQICWLQTTKMTSLLLRKVRKRI